MRRRLAAAVSVILGLSFAVAVPTTAMAETVEPTPDVVINELHSNDPTGAKDWVELHNRGETPADVSGWRVRDNSARPDTLPVGTIIPAGGYLRISDGTEFAFGLGNGDEFHLATPEGVDVDSASFPSHPSTSWGRCPDGTGPFGLTAAATPGEENACGVDPADVVVINEVESNGDPAGDWVELMNTGLVAVNVGGLIIKDADDTHVFVIPDGTMIAAGEYAAFVVDDAAALGTAAFGLGASDRVRLFAADGTTLIEEYVWTAHAGTSYGRCPDGTGEFALTASTTRAAANDCVLPEGAANIRINELVSNPSDWVELYNSGETDVDVSGWHVDDDQPRTDVLPAGSIVPAGGFLVLDNGVDFSFGLGNGDSFRLFLTDGVTLVDETSYTAHPTTSWGRCPDGSGTFGPTVAATPGAANDCPAGNPVDALILNEVESDGTGSDWIELYNPTTVQIDASGLIAKDSGEGNNVVLPASSLVAPGSYLAIDVTGLGGTDAARLFTADGATLIDETTWSGHADETWGRCPDAVGAFGETEAATRGAANLCPPPVGWEGVVINEVESSGGVPGDWVELTNTGTVAVDLTGWIVKDNDDTHALAIEAGTTIEPGGFAVVYTDVPADGFGLGNPDEPRLFLPDGTTLVDSYSYTAHAPSTTYGRCPDGTGEFVLTFGATPGAANDCSPVRINEIESQGGTPGDWIELVNVGSSPVDVTGYVLRDNNNASAVVIPTATIPAGGFLAVDVEPGFGLGGADSARLFAADGVTLLDSHTWDTHAASSYARCPDGIGAFEIAETVTKGAANDCVGVVATTPWPGDSSVVTASAPGAFGADMSGLAFEATGGRGTLWAVNNGTGTLYKLTWDAAAKRWVAASGDWAAGKTLRYPGGTGAVDAEGVGLVAGTSAVGVYVASERDNSASGVSRPSVLLYDVSAAGTTLTATMEWNLAALLPTLPANGGLEGIAWVPDADLVAQGFVDQSTGSLYDPARYAGHGEGLFFVGVEGTARIYAVALNSDGTADLIATIDPKLAVVAEVAYDAASGLLYAVCDDACAGQIVAMAVAPTGPYAGTFQAVRSSANPAGMADTIANEGFAIGECVGGSAPVFYADDSANGGYALREGVIYCGTVPGADTVLLNLLNINDFHGRIDGNTAAFAGTVEQLRAAFGEDNSLFLSAGDNIGASLFASAYFDDQPTIDVLNALDLAASAVGNHEFDKGFADLTDRVIPASDFPILGANVYLKGTTTPALPAYATFDVAGVTVAVIGTVTQETPSLVSPGGIADLDFGDPVAAVNRVAADLTDGDPGNGEADVIVAEYHEGSVDGVVEGATIEEEIAAGGAFARIVTQTDAAVDVIFTGHTHKEYAWDGPIPGGEGTRPILQTGSYGANIGQVLLSVDPASGDVEAYAVRNVARTTASASVLAAAFPRVAEVASIVDATLAQAAIVGNTPVGAVTADITTAFGGGSFVDGVWTGGSRDNRAAQSTLGNLVADSLVASLSDPTRGGAEIGLVNPGGLRNELLHAGDGVITYAEANAVLPFVNNLWTTTLTGAQFVAALEQQWQPEGSARPYLQLGVSDNVFYTFDATAPRGERITGVWIDGEPIDLEDTYRIGSFSFLLQGGDNFTALAGGADTRDSGLIDRDAWIDYIEANSPLSPDFASRSAQITGLPATIEEGQTLTATVSGLNLTSRGAPENTTALLSFAGSTAIFDPIPVVGGVAEVSVTVPADAPTNSELVLTVSPSGTEVRAAVTVTGSLDPVDPVDPGPEEGDGSPTTAPTEAELTPETENAIQVPGGTTFEPGETITLTVGVAYAGEEVTGWLYSTPTYLGTAIVAADGTATFTVPAGMPAGTHRLVVTNATGTVIGWMYVTVDAAGEVTGGALGAFGGTAEALTLLPWAAGSVLFGVLALFVIRRRSTRREV